MSTKYHMVQSAKLESLAGFRQLVEVACEEHPEIGAQTCYHLKLAVDEACSNVVMHGYAGLEPGPLSLTLKLAADHIRATITDHGRPFEPHEPPPPDIHAKLEQGNTGGFGLFLIYQLMDQVRYKTGDDGNHLTLICNLPGSPAQPTQPGEPETTREN